VADANCPVGEAPPAKFRITEGIPAALCARIERFLTASGVEIAGVEFITEMSGRTLVYDVNTNTNYNPEAEVRAGVAGTRGSGPGAIAAFLGAVLADLRPAA
jgi:hypothetical protein